MTLTVKCPECGLAVLDVAQADVAYARDGNGNVLCPNCRVPTRPVGQPASGVPPAAKSLAADQCLREIASARTRVLSLQAAHEKAKEQAKVALNNYDESIDSFVILCGQMTAVAPVLPLFDEPLPLFDEPAQTQLRPDEVARLMTKLADAGVKIPWHAIASWTPAERDEAYLWATIEGSVESMPPFVAEAATAPP